MLKVLFYLRLFDIGQMILPIQNNLPNSRQSLVVYKICDLL